MAPYANVQEVFVEFRAGKMVMDGACVNPDTRKGLIRIGRGEKGLVHFQCIDRATNLVQDDQIIFPDEAVFEKEPKSETDAQLCNSVNMYLNQHLASAAEDESDASVPAQSSEVNVAAEDESDASVSAQSSEVNVAVEDELDALVPAQCSEVNAAAEDEPDALVPAQSSEVNVADDILSRLAHMDKILEGKCSPEELKEMLQSPVCIQC